MRKINYKAHIPAGITFAGIFALLTGWFSVIPLLIGGAIGGALPDIDIEGAAVEKLGGKTAGFMNKTVGRFGGFGRSVTRVTSALGLAIDKIFLSPIAKGWRFLSKNVFGRVYRKIYEIGDFGPNHQHLGDKLKWLDDKSPWSHRGGITHSLSFLFTSCVLTVPLALLFQSFPLWVGCELGILSHLFADACCKSGVKLFFPWHPPIGFKNDSGKARGDDLRILPAGLQVVTGKDHITNAELDDYADQDKARRDRRLRFREKMWQWLFKLAALAVIVLLIMGYGAAPADGDSGEQAAGGNPIEQVQNMFGGNKSKDFSETAEPSNNQTAANANIAGTQTSGNASATQTTTPGENVPAGGDNPSNYIPIVSTAAVGEQGAYVIGVNPLTDMKTDGESIPETAGPTSLTVADIDVKDLPRGIMKMPDESLWIVGVGPLTEANLENPKWQFTPEEKKWLLSLIGVKRTGDIPTSADAWLNSKKKEEEAAAAAEKQQKVEEKKENAGSGILGWLSGITGVDLGQNTSYTGGFLGLTEWTSS